MAGPGHVGTEGSAWAPRGDGSAVLLVRHAESEANVGDATEQETDSPLTVVGRGQAAALAEALRHAPIEVLVSSDARRARDTLAPLATALGQTVRVSALLREPRSGRRTTQFVDPQEAATMLDRLRAGGAPSAALPPPETHAEVVARLRSFLDDLGVLPPGPTVVILSHFVTLNVLVRLLTDARDPPASLWAQFDNASITRVDVPAGSSPPLGTLRYLNRAL